jgi:hypothetical protein
MQSQGPNSIRYLFGFVLNLQTIGIVSNGVKNIANHNISPILSNTLYAIFSVKRLLEPVGRLKSGRCSKHDFFSQTRINKISLIEVT